ncbi:phosphomannomutase/phosphoglucomutase [Kitasatospora sp. NPDC048365]|uniref:phosphomannomutase/phosphoglucomutase n=1 Tax=Kitasatospora sp. NPDC048365 TaxID=3364050 RepID=UPI00371137D0
MRPETAAHAVRTYDIRGLSPEELDEEAAYRIGAAFAGLVGAPLIAVVRDMRLSSPALAAAFTKGVLEQGVDVLDAGLGSTDRLYYLSGLHGVPGAMVTASHNPAGWNGFKLCRAGAVPVAEGSGLEHVRAALLGPRPQRAAVTGVRRPAGPVEEFAAHLRSLVDLTGLRPLTVVVDAGNGMAGQTAPLVLDHPALRLVPLHFELDGSFPHHEADPMKPANLAELRARVVAEGADLGLAFDGDADRVFAVDERGEPVPAAALLALLAGRLLAAEPGAAVVHNLIAPRSAVAAVERAGGVPVRTRVGHSHLKAAMAEHLAVLGGEHSGHYYFRDFWFADSGLLAALHLLAELSVQARPLSKLAAGHDRWAGSGELNLEVADPAGAVAAVERSLGDSGARVDRLDGLTAEFPDGSWFNLRASRTEAVLRLNAEAPDTRTLDALTDHVLSAVRDAEQN